MKRQMLAGFVGLLAIATASPTFGVTFRLVTQLDTAALEAGVPGSVTAYGNHVYVGNLFDGPNKLHHIVNPLSTPSKVASFGTAPGGNGFVSLSTDGVTVLAATENSGANNDIANAYEFGTDVLKWSLNSSAAQLNTQNKTIEGAGVDPISGRPMLTCFGCDAQHFYNATTGASVSVPGANILFYPGVGTGWRDVDYDKATGDIYLRAVGGVARGKRIGDGQFQTLEATAGIQTIVDGINEFEAAINVAFLPASFAGQDLVILNHRSAANTFAQQVLLYSATPPSAGGVATDTPVAASFVLADGVTPFTTSAAGSGIYDFSFDPVNSLLYVSDFSTSQIHIFGLVPEPTSALLLAAAGISLIARRR